VVGLLIACLLLVAGICLLGTLLPVKVALDLNLTRDASPARKRTPVRAAVAGGLPGFHRAAAAGRAPGSHRDADVELAHRDDDVELGHREADVELDADTRAYPVESSRLPTLFRLGTDVGAMPLRRATTVGRSSSCDIRLPDSRVSRRHARLCVEHDTVLLDDLGSTNGTAVNGQPLRGTVQLHEGDLVSFGGTVACRLECSEETLVQHR
jgi:FHA domain